MSVRLALALAAVTMGGNVITSPTSTSPHAASPDIASAGLALARLIYPSALNTAINDYTFRNIVTPTYHANVDLKRLEAEHPGIVDAIIAGMRPAFDKARDEALPVLWATTGAIYAESLTLAELRQAIAFYESPGSQRLELLEEAAISYAAPPAGSKVVLFDAPGPARDDIEAKRLFEMTSAGRKLPALQLRIGKATDVWNNEATPVANALTNAAIAKVVERFIGSGGGPR